MTIHALFKFAPNPYGGIEIDTTSSLGIYRELSPFTLGPINTYVPGLKANNFENLWQFSKVYKQHVNEYGQPTTEWLQWRYNGWVDSPRAVRYPMGKGAIPEYLYWDGEKLGYIEARKKIYAPIYAEYVIKTESYRRLQSLHESLYDNGKPLILRDYDAYDHIKLGMTLKDVINNPNRKMGHAFVLIMILTGTLDECLK